MKRLTAVAGVLFSALLVSQCAADLRACEGAFARKDWATALRECRSAAEKGNAEAQFNLGVMYDYGRGVPEDRREAVKWYRLASAQGHADAQYHFAALHNSGLGVPQDYAEAAKWYRRAAEQGHASAQYVLGLMYKHGVGVPQDPVSAHMWLNLAAARSSEPEDQEQAADARERVAGSMARAQTEEARRMARDWKPKPERPAEPTRGK